ncbi:MAG: glucose 1-dehydrogenase [Methylobacterium sp.]|jgi:NAD(P)-dependent dehydrogenase (short-subunit alcohol dehydrogenase family)|nr:glucose 1-dehydrogenase [Methylobacterium sp.]MCA3602372.1 glucose 1-dehydrogenase [Methylobacterium sp.]MCA3610923.1 glucose 1-dehydrogenase [Methylobacterium sp.]MCA3613910.1 glucose 1-dehydrogenase [Methylobacterium sp.]MCA3627093.1 glucose 1-dehydrogenase [Methylobacterium sp.]
MRRLEGKVAIVTGGAGGMGRATAMLFAREGASVVVGDVDTAAGTRLELEAATAGLTLSFQHCDVSVEAHVAALVALAESRFGKLDTIFNNAGIEQSVTPSTDVSEALFDRVIGVNLKGTFFGCKHAIPALLRNGGGTIVNNSSVSAFANVGFNISYAASKGAVMSMTRVLAIEYAKKNIRVNAINPGVIDTEMNRRNKALAADPDAWTARSLAVTPMGRMGTGDEIAETVLFLSSEQSSFITGVGLLIDGGRVAT